MPSVQADLLAVLAVVAELVVTGPAEGVAVAAVVVGGADHAVLVLQVRVALVGGVRRPSRAGRQLPLGGQPTDQLVAV